MQACSLVRAIMSEKTESFVWQCQKQACDLIIRILDDARAKNQFLRAIEQELLLHTSTNLFDWIDHVEVGYSEALYSELLEAGFAQEITGRNFRVFIHPAAKLPMIVLKDQSVPFLSVSIGVESIADFLLVRGLSYGIEGAPLSHFRRACVSKEQGVFVYVVERRGTLYVEPNTFQTQVCQNTLLAYEKWKTRARNYDDVEQEDEAMKQALEIAQELVGLCGAAMSASIVLDVERQYWQSKNRAAQVQKNRQDALGMGWANHDHHTFRSSRRAFRSLVRLFEILGFYCRERFYAGLEAGWGAQVMEHKISGLVLFLDVDLQPHEVAIDFAHLPLVEETKLGTIGLWCALHGESILKAGMHHLEAQFNFEKLESDLEMQGVKMMTPFTNLGHLRQAFSVGQMWPVSGYRIQKLAEKGLITEAEAERFRTKGALGSHLENLERKEGYKGFHQKSVSDIIHRTDPRGE